MGIFDLKNSTKMCKTLRFGGLVLCVMVGRKGKRENQEVKRAGPPLQPIPMIKTKTRYSVMRIQNSKNPKADKRSRR